METRPRSRPKLRSVVLICVLLAVSGIVYFGYFCPDQVCALTSRETSWTDWTFRFPVHDNAGKPLSSIHTSLVINSKASSPGPSYDDVLNENFQFDMNAHDVMVFLHIQKTGGTSFGKHLVRDLDLERPCTCQRKRKRCYCFRPNRNENWLFSRYSTGWKCGLHADWTELTSCVDTELDKNEGETVKRRYFYITLLREPISRYLSEFRHVQRGATWRSSRHWCGGRAATPDELPRCYPGKTWWGVTLEDFAHCQANLAANRQTRMLADLSLVGCYNASAMTPAERDRVMLESAKRNLAAMAFFGLTEHQKVDQYVFEETFNLRFAVPFEQHNATLSGATLASVPPDQLALIRRLNALDLELYAFARRLMYRRFVRLKERDKEFGSRFAHLGELPGRQAVDAFNWDQLTGEWNLAILVLDAAKESYQEDSHCVHGEMRRGNETTYRQVWHIDTPDLQLGATLNLVTVEEAPGVWTAISPLGGVLHTTVLAAQPHSHAVLMFCGEREGRSAHLWTAVVTRERALSAAQLVHLAALLVAHGFHPATSKLITWNQCQPH